MQRHQIFTYLLLFAIGWTSCLPIDNNYSKNLAASPSILPPPNPPKTEKSYEAYSPLYDSLFQRFQTTMGFNGTVLIAEKGEVIHTGAYGLAHFRNKDSLNVNSNFQLASVSKMFTATAIMMLYEEGLLHPDDFVCEYLPEFPYDNISIRHLLNHRSGLCRYMALADEHWEDSRPLSNKDVLCLFEDHQPELWFIPGSKFNYINTNYALLALIVEEISGQTFDTFMKEKVFEPLDMTHSLAYTELKKQTIHKQAFGYKGGRRRRIPVGHDYLDGVMGDKGIYSNVIDLYKFDKALREGKIVSLSIQEEAYQKGSPELRTHNYGFGLRMKTRYPNIVYHFGWWRGFITCFIRDLKEDKTLIILCNRDRLRRSLDFWYIFFLEERMKEQKTKKNNIDSISSQESLPIDTLHQTDTFSILPAL